MDPGELPDLLRTMDVMVVPSRDEEVMRETFSQAMVQGMLSGLPVIANDLPVLTEKLDQGGGLVVRSVKEMSEAMDKLAGDPVLRRRLGEEARRTALARYVWDTEAFVDKFLFPGNRGTYFSHGEARTKD
jgi:glycosyltransferase involved in cell wall biosynthesis